MLGKSWLAGLAAVLAVFLVLLRSTWSPAWLGFAHDDSLYWSSAQALAEGRGYVMPSVPGEPPQTKYPVLYPWVLSWVWRWSADFPANLIGALWANAAFGVAFLTGAVVLLRQLGAGPVPALCLAGFCAAHPQMLSLSGLLLSDVPFMALAMGAAVFCEAGLSRMRQEESQGWPLWLLGALLAMLAVMTRSIGLAVVAGAGAAALAKRQPKAALVTAVFGGAGFLPAILAGPSSSGIAPAAGYPGYEQTMLFYTSYVGFWRFSLPDLATFWDQAAFNLLEFLKTPAVLVFLVPAGGFVGAFWQSAGVALSAGILRGVFRAASPRTWHPVHFMFFFHIPIVLAWNYTLMERFLLLFLPMFLWGAYKEIAAILSAARDVFRQRKPLGDRLAASLILALAAGLLIYAGYRETWESPVATAESRDRREALAEEKSEAYRWIREHTALEDRFIAYEDANLYLHTGRQALRPLAISTASFFQQDKAILDWELEHLGDTARAVGARYWLVAADDFHLESAEEFLQKATSDLLDGAPAVFVTQGGRVRIYDVSGLGATHAGPMEGRGSLPTAGGEGSGGQHLARTSVTSGICRSRPRA
jgi:hypothetical protein